MHDLLVAEFMRFRYGAAESPLSQSQAPTTRSDDALPGTNARATFIATLLWAACLAVSVYVRAIPSFRFATVC